MTEIDKKRDSYNKLIEVLEDALGKAAAALGPEARDSSSQNRIAIHEPGEIYQYLGELLDETLKARSKLK